MIQRIEVASWARRDGALALVSFHLPGRGRGPGRAAVGGHSRSSGRAEERLETGLREGPRRVGFEASDTMNRKTRPSAKILTCTGETTSKLKH